MNQLEQIEKIIEILLNHKLDKRKSQHIKDRSGYDAGWIDGLKWVISEIEKKKSKVIK